jgi:hypothetical protein
LVFAYDRRCSVSGVVWSCRVAIATADCGLDLGQALKVNDELGTVDGKLREVFVDPLRSGSIERALRVVALKGQHFTDALDHQIERLCGAPVISDADGVGSDVGMKDRCEHAADGSISRIAMRQRHFEFVLVVKGDVAVALSQGLHSQRELVALGGASGHAFDLDEWVLSNQALDCLVVRLQPL